MNRIFLMGVGALVLAALGGCAEKADVQGNVLHGNVDDRELKLAFVLSERLSSVLPEEGTSVKKGDLVATLETVRIENDVAVARAAGAVREAQLAVAKALLEKSENGSRAEDVAMVTAGTQALEAKIKAARLAFERNRTLVKTRAVPQQTADDSEAEFHFLQNTLGAVTNYLAKLVAGDRAEDRAAARARVAEAQSALLQAKAQLAVAEQRLRDANLYAPADGIVRERLLEPGEMTSPQRPVLALALTNPKWVRCYLRETELAKHRLNDRATVKADGAPAPFEGWIGYIAPTAEFTPKNIETDELRPTLVYEVRIYVKDPQGLLKLGAPVVVEL